MVNTDKAFEILVTEHHRRLLAYALSLTRSEAEAKDLVQEALLTAYRKLDTFDGTRSFPAWLRGIIRFKYLNALRSRGMEVPWDPQELYTLDQAHRYWDRAENYPGELFQALSDCLGKLPELLKAPLHLFYFERVSGTEMAGRLACNEATLRKRLERGRSWLGSCIQATLAGDLETAPPSQTEPPVGGEVAP